MDLIIKTVSRLVFPIALVFGVFLALHAHLSPGGGFPAGVVFGTAFALIIIAYSERDVEHRLTKHELIDVKSLAGVVLIVTIVLKAGSFFRDELLATQTFFELWSGGFTPFLNIAGALMVATAIILIVYTIEAEQS